ncbi:MAG: hypothetical protein JWN29_3349 [Acidimicrobiales bacterium]|jgi:hypothetical protein|nr:hypothetical protein [Acidimicrobiales bacterium]
MPSSHVVVDGSNIATEGRSLPSLVQLDEAVRAFLAERPHDVCTVVVDATFEHRIDPSEKQMYDEALAANELLTPPAGSIGRGDKFILEIADRVGANVFSNDSFQEFHGEYEWLFDEGRLVGGKPVPGVGWVFIERTPVRGPKSRMATRAAGRKRTRAASGSAVKKASRSGPTSSGADLGPMPTPKAPPPRGRGRKAIAAETEPEADRPTEEAGGGRGRRRRGGRGGGNGASDAPPVVVDPVNLPLPFIEFVAEHQPGSLVEGEVVEFSSHGAYVLVGDVRCYAPLKLLGDPAPRSAREILNRGEMHQFVVHAIHAARRGIDLALPGVAEVELAAAEAAPAKKRLSTRKRAAGKTVTEAPTGAATDTDQASGKPGAEQPESEATLAATTKATAKKAPAKKATAKKTTAAKKATAVKKAPAKKTTAKKTVAKKTVAKKTVAKKATVKKAPAKKAVAKKTAAKKAPAKKAVAKKTVAKKTTAKKAPAKKSPAKRTTAAKKR